MTNHHALPDRRTMTLDRRPRKPVDPKIHQFIPIEKFKQVIQIPPMPIPVETPSNSSAVTRNGGGRGDFCTVNVPPSSSGRHVSSSGEAATQQRGTTHSRSSSLEMILTPLVTSTRTRLQHKTTAHNMYVIQLPHRRRPITLLIILVIYVSLYLQSFDPFPWKPFLTHELNNPTTSHLPSSRTIGTPRVHNVSTLCRTSHSYMLIFIFNKFCKKSIYLYKQLYSCYYFRSIILVTSIFSTTTLLRLPVKFLASLLPSNRAYIHRYIYIHKILDDFLAFCIYVGLQLRILDNKKRLSFSG